MYKIFGFFDLSPHMSMFGSKKSIKLMQPPLFLETPSIGARQKLTLKQKRSLTRGPYKRAPLYMLRPHKFPRPAAFFPKAHTSPAALVQLC